MDKIQEGDLLQLKGVDGPLYCEVVSILDNEFEVYFVEPQGEWLWAYSKEWHKVPMESWETHVPVVNRDYKSAYMELGFKALDGVHFVKLSDESNIPKNFELPIGSVDSGDESMEETQSDREFIASDSEEHFTYAEGKFAEETHKAVRQYHLWEPATQDEWRVKNFIDYLDRKYCMKEAEQSFWAGEHVSLTNPPIYPDCSSRK